MHWEFKEHAVLASTQLTADKMARDGAGEGTVVVAVRQTAGRGRLGRTWASPKGGLYMSLILRPYRLDPHTLTLVGALSVVEGVESANSVKAGIRWPNDVMVMGKKVAGVVGSANYQGSTPDYVILGIGVNCNVPARSLEGVGQSSTSLMEILGARVDVNAVRGHVLEALARNYSAWQKGGEEVLRRVASLLTTVGAKVEFKNLGRGRRAGVATALSEDGSLLVRVGRSVIRLKAEGLEWLREKRD